MDTTSSTTESLERELVQSEVAIARHRASQMSLLRELDRRQAALRDGHRSLAEWVAGRLDVAPETARTVVSTARRLEDLPEVDEAVASGVIGFDRAVAVSRCAGRDDSLDILCETAGFDVAGIRRLVAGRRRMTRVDEECAFNDRYLSVEPNLDESAWRLHGQLPGFAGRIVVDALEARGDVFPYGPDAAPSRTTRNADALWSLALDGLTGSDGASVASSAPTVSVFVDATQAAPTSGEAGVQVEAGPQVGPHTLEAILCDGVIEVTARTDDGTPPAMGRRSRVIPPRLRRFVLHRDGAACTITGCVSRYRLQIHHIRPWSEGGRTDPDNLTAVCWFHHHVVIHGRGFTIDPDTPAQRRRLQRPPIHAPPAPATWQAASPDQSRPKTPSQDSHHAAGTAKPAFVTPADRWGDAAELILGRRGCLPSPFGTGRPPP